MNIHPSQFENPQTVNIKDELTLKRLSELREVKLDKTIDEPKGFKIIDETKDLTGSNTRHLFKNLYGETPLTFLFFSEQNVNNIQNVIRYLVYKETLKVIDRQNSTELLVIMRSIFLEYSRHPKLIDPNMDIETIEKLKKEYTKEVERLNELVINETVPRVLSALQQYMSYLRDASTQPIPIERSKDTSITGTQSYRSTTSVLLGTNL